MTQRERLLAILVGGVLVLGVGQWGFSKYKSAIDFKKNQYTNLQDKILLLSEKTRSGCTR